MKTSYNYLAIIVSAIANWILGFLWFTKIFLEPYTDGLGKTQAQMDAGLGLWESLVLQFIGNVLLSFVLAWLLKNLGYTTIGQSVKLSLILWLGFIVAIIGPMYAFQAYSLQFFLINSLGVLVYILVGGIILTLWKNQRSKDIV